MKERIVKHKFGRTQTHKLGISTQQQQRNTIKDNNNNNNNNNNKHLGRSRSWTDLKDDYNVKNYETWHQNESWELGMWNFCYPNFCL